MCWRLTGILIRLYLTSFKIHLFVFSFSRGFGRHGRPTTNIWASLILFRIQKNLWVGPQPSFLSSPNLALQKLLRCSMGGIGKLDVPLWIPTARPRTTCKCQSLSSFSFRSQISVWTCLLSRCRLNRSHVFRYNPETNLYSYLARWRALRGSCDIALLRSASRLPSFKVAGIKCSTWGGSEDEDSRL